MSSFNRLTNELRAALTRLPVWTTEADRQRALSYTDQPLEGAREAIEAIRTGQRAPSNLGLLLAVARYEDAGWMPDGCFEQWRRWGLHGIERLDSETLIQWLGTVESNLQRKLLDHEDHLSSQCLQEEKNLRGAQFAVTRARQHLHNHYQALILARLSVGDTTGAVEIAQRVPAGPTRDEIDKILHAHTALSSSPDRATEHPGTPTPDTAPNIQAILHRLHMSSELPPDAAHQDACDELVARRQADPNTEEREALKNLKQLIKSAAYPAHEHGPVLAALVDRLLGHVEISNTGIYIASRTHRAARWRRLRDIEGWEITSSWIDEAGPGESPDLNDLWSRVEAEIARSKLLILYVETEDFPLKGALIEVGIAIGTRIPICIVAPGVILDPVSFRPLGSWVRHPLVSFCDTMDEAQSHCAIAGRRE